MLSCPLMNSNFKAMIDCLRKIPAEDIMKTFYDFFELDTGKRLKALAC